MLSIFWHDRMQIRKIAAIIPEILFITAKIIKIKLMNVRTGQTISIRLISSWYNHGWADSFFVPQEPYVMPLQTAQSYP